MFHRQPRLQSILGPPSRIPQTFVNGELAVPPAKLFQPRSQRRVVPRLIRRHDQKVLIELLRQYICVVFMLTEPCNDVPREVDLANKQKRRGESRGVRRSVNGESKYPPLCSLCASARAESPSDSPMTRPSPDEVLGTGAQS